MISIRPLISNFSSPLSSFWGPFWACRLQLVSISLHVPPFLSSAKFEYLSPFSFSLIFILWSTGTPKSTIVQVTFSVYYQLVCNIILIMFIRMYQVILFTPVEVAHKISQVERKEKISRPTVPYLSKHFNL